MDIPPHAVVLTYPYWSNSLSSLIVSTLASSGVPFSRIITLQFLVHVAWILFCFLRMHAHLAMSAFFLVRCSFRYTPVPFNFLACLSNSFFYFRFTNLTTITGFAPLFLRGRVWQATTLSLWIFIFLLSKNFITCLSSVWRSSGRASSPTLSLATVLSYVWCVVSSPSF